jgi:hypothetical protein
VAARRQFPERVVAMLTFLIARTERDAWKAIGKYEDSIPDLADAHIVTTFGGNWGQGARMERVYLAPGAEGGPHYDRVVQLARRNMIRMRNSDRAIRVIHPDGTWTEEVADGVRVE